MWLEVLSSVPTHPFGFGLGKVGHAAARSESGSDGQAPSITDGWYLKVLAEGGVPLLILGFALQFAVGQQMGRRWHAHSDRTLRQVFAVALAAFVAGSTQAVFSNLWDLFFAAHLLWIVVGATACPIPSGWRPEGQPQPVQGPPPPLPRRYVRTVS